MQTAGIVIIIVGLLLMAFAIMTRRRTREAASTAAGSGQEAAPAISADRPRPAVSAFHVVGEEAQVTFDVPLSGEGPDDLMKELLVNEALEVTREKRHHLPIEQVTEVVALAGRGEVTEVGRIRLPAPGELPPPLTGAAVLDLSAVDIDPLDEQFEGRSDSTPQAASSASSDELGPVGPELRLPRAVDVGLRAQGIDPDTMSAGELLRGTLTVFGYQISQLDDHQYQARRAGTTTLIYDVPHQAGDYQEVTETAIRDFTMNFLASKADRGILVSDKYGPFEVYERERNDSRVRFVTRERLQNFLDSLALS